MLGRGFSAIQFTERFLMSSQSYEHEKQLVIDKTDHLSEQARDSFSETICEL